MSNRRTASKSNPPLSQSSKPSLGENIYEGAASYGRFMSTLGLILSIIIGIVLIYFGVKFELSPNVYTESTMAQITKAQCNQSIDKDNNVNYTCTLNITYTTKATPTTPAQTLNRMISVTSRTIYQTGGVIQVQYNPDNPQDVRSSSLSKHQTGWILIGIAIFIIIGAIIWYYIAHRYKFAAAAGGFDSALDLFRS